MKPRLSFWQIINMNIGFFGIQFSFGLQQSSMSPIYKYLGADEASLPYLWLAGPMTGPAGAAADRRHERPHGHALGPPHAVLPDRHPSCSLGLLAMPFSPTLWFAASLLWILDAANNVTMEPYRAFVSDKLQPEQHSIGFLTQSAFTGLGQTLAYLTPSLLVWLGMNKDAVNGSHIPHIVIVAFMIGAVFSISSVLWTLKTTKENPLSEEELRGHARQAGRLAPRLGDIVSAVRDAAPCASWRGSSCSSGTRCSAIGSTSCCPCRPPSTAPPTRPRKASAMPVCWQGKWARSTTSSPSSARWRWCRSRAAMDRRSHSVCLRWPAPRC
jgi:maltose/moltooligosaccharide transporter